MRADRLLQIMMLLQARGRMTAYELSDELEVSERTIYRDLEALNGAGVPVLTERGPGGGGELCAQLQVGQEAFFRQEPGARGRPFAERAVPHAGRGRPLDRGRFGRRK